MVPPRASAPLVLTVTPNPSLDLLFEADTLVWDDANRVAEPRRRAGGQGINVARAVKALGGDAAAVAILGGATGDALEKAIRRESIDLFVVPAPEETRIFVAVHERERARSLLVNPRGPACTDGTGAALADAVRRAVVALRPVWVAACGSLPPGLEPSQYAALGAIARAAACRFVPDCDGAALRLAAEAGCDLLVPNRHEAERLLGIRIPDVAGAASAAADLRERFRLRVAAITLGPDGAVLAADDGLWHARPPVVTGASAVGAGDAFLAGLLLAFSRDEPADNALRLAVAAGTAVLSGTGDVLLAPDAERVLRPRITVRRL